MKLTQPWSLCSTDEGLAAIGILSSVGHGEYASAGMLKLEVLVLELHTVNRLSANAVAVCEVTTLKHKVRDHTVES